jgi:hypothetical protein
MDKKNQRRAELTGKFIVMSEALMKEGFESDDKQIISASSLLMMLGTLLLNEDEMEEFIKLSSMFTSNKILGMFEEKGIDLTKYLIPTVGNDSFDIILEKMRKDIENHFKKKDEGEGEE